MDELNEGKILYAVIKVMDPNTDLPKIVFINWVCNVLFIGLFEGLNVWRASGLTVYIWRGLY